jgi:dCTP diphosphatase
MSSEFEDLLNKIQNFSDARDWSQFHTPKNLILAATGELGELAELLQWKDDQEVTEYLASKHGKERISEEIADIAIYLIRLCQMTNIDFLDAIQNKIKINEIKYPIETSKGNSEKYTRN